MNDGNVAFLPVNETNVVSWCQWILSIPKDANPANRTGHEDFTITSGPVFLAPTTERLSEQCVERRGRIPARKDILFPVTVAVCSRAEKPNDDLSLRASRNIDQAYTNSSSNDVN
jgi:hypothetical protein